MLRGFGLRGKARVRPPQDVAVRLAEARDLRGRASNRRWSRPRTHSSRASQSGKALLPRVGNAALLGAAAIAIVAEAVAQIALDAVFDVAKASQNAVKDGIDQRRGS